MPARRAGKNVQKHLVVDAHIRVHIILQAAVFHFILPLQRHLPANFARGAFIGHRPGHRVVIQAAHRRAPVVHQNFAIRVLQAVKPDDDLLLFLRAVLLKVHARKEGIHQHGFVPLRQIIRQRLSRQKTIHLCGELLHILHAQRRRLQAQLLPRVRQQRAYGAQMPLRIVARSLDHRQEQLLHVRGVLLFFGKLGLSVHGCPSFAVSVASAFQTIFMRNSIPHIRSIVKI